ncbi:PRTRC system protein C [Deinococcus planocerae]|uniref:PRTRC system protein C n=1 Tax=Deinococcus planocerae TaxID=1737569 RepID=UPI000C7EFBEC|nr:PRTRC system protein C [Deinococcus planocerae]
MTQSTEVTVTAVQRKIVYEGRELADVSPTVSVEDVVKIHALTTPELATAVVEGPELQEGQRVYTVKKRLGTKG